MGRKRDRVPYHVRLSVYNRDSGRCGYCPTKLPFNQMTVDHRIPLVRGGDDQIDNLILSCFQCNNIKGSFTEHEFREYLRENKKTLGG